MFNYFSRKMLLGTLRFRVLRVISLVMVVLLLLISLNVQPILAETAQSQAFVPLTASNVTPLIRHSDVIKKHDLEPNKQLDLTIALKLRNKEDLKQKILKARKAGISGRVVSDRDLEDNYLPNENEHNEVINYLKSQGLQIIKTYNGRMAIKVRGTAQQIEKAFDVNISYFAENGNEFYANTTQPQLPGEIAGSVECISGLNNLRFKPVSSGRVAAASTSAYRTVSYTPQQIQKAYNLTTAYTNNINGKGVNLAIATYYSFKQSDIKTFLAYNNISGTKSIQVIPVDGTPTYDEGGSGESTLDIECALSSAPGAQLMVYDGADAYLDTGIDLFTKIVDDNKANIISYSWGLEEESWEPSQVAAMDSLFAAGAAKGMTFVVASGDSGSSEISYPATDPNVISVGGTTLNTNSSTGLISSESSWSGSGGGGSTIFAQPDWQQSVIKSPSGNRMFPDVSLNADPYTGYQFYFDGVRDTIGGTSAAAPEWAAIFALVDQSRLNNGLGPIGLANPALYALNDPSVFHDITSGSNGDYEAGVGYDMVTGLGSVDAWGLIKALSNLTDEGVPASVTDLSVSSPNPKELDLTWSPVNDALSYNVYRSTSATGNYTLVGTSVAANYNDLDLAPSTEYYYKVSAVNDNGEGPQSSVVKGITKAVELTKVTGVTLNKTSTVINKGSSEVLTAVISPTNATNTDVVWTSSRTSVATVDQQGKVVGVNAGTAVITVRTKDGGKKATCTVKVNVPVADIRLNKTAATLNVKSSCKLTAYVTPTNATNKSVSWTTSDSAVVTVNQTGKVVGVKAGTATITATSNDGGKIATCTITVNNPVKGIALSTSRLTIKVGSSDTLTATVLPSDATNQDVSWKSSNPAVVSVDNMGNVTGLKVGSASITVTTLEGSKKGVCRVSVVR